MLGSIGKVSRIHRKYPKSKARVAHASVAKSTVRARIAHVFARQKDQMALFIRTIGIAPAETKITLANLARKHGRLILHEGARRLNSFALRTPALGVKSSRRLLPAGREALHAFAKPA